jgi:hypothetical protein
MTIRFDKKKLEPDGLKWVSSGVAPASRGLIPASRRNPAKITSSVSVKSSIV